MKFITVVRVHCFQILLYVFIFIVGSFGAKNPIVTDKVFLTIAIDGETVGDIVIGLFGEIVPKTVRNFKELASHKNGFGYRGSRFHRVDKFYYIQGGSFKYGNITGGTSIYGRYFETENFKLKHYGQGWVSMANSGPDRNGSQFFIVTYQLELFDNKNVVFGKVLRGMPIVKMIQSLEQGSAKPPSKPCIIVNSGTIEVEKPFPVSKTGSPDRDPVSLKSVHSEL
uniref:peptidyl-prolyl cis-trans isomerase 6-like n=1 Tax=Styela clava TaxID=7725 RepID=UPI00193A7182|nr:peptidyl-prolyl cis-trans isomerase 6-like [Styela clava]